jgi:hypothetical protein
MSARPTMTSALGKKVLITNQIKHRADLSAQLAAAVQDTMVIGETRILVQTSGPKGSGHSPAACAENGADQRRQDARPGRSGEHVTERRHPSGELRLCRFEQPVIRHLNPEPNFGAD